MSKLYDVISRLDEIASLEEKNQAIPDIPFQYVKNRSSLLRILILSGTSILLGLAVIGITAWWQGWFDLHQGTSVQAAIIPEHLTDAPAISPPITIKKSEENIVATAKPAITAPSAGQIPHHQQEDSANRKNSQMTDRLNSLPNSATIKESPTVIAQLPVKALKRDRQINMQQQAMADITTEPKPLSMVQETESLTGGKVIEQTAQLSRWLQQAEQHRRTGDWEGAVNLFAKVWQISANPAVANNLAASLIQLDRLPEAHDILVKALQKAPQDQDLKQNLQIVQQLVRR